MSQLRGGEKVFWVTTRASSALVDVSGITLRNLRSLSRWARQGWHPLGLEPSLLAAAVGCAEVSEQVMVQSDSLDSVLARLWIGRMDVDRDLQLGLGRHLWPIDDCWAGRERHARSLVSLMKAAWVYHPYFKKTGTSPKE